MTRAAGRSAKRTTVPRFLSEEAVMKVIRSKVIGYCFGVANTIEKAQQCIEISKAKKLPCYSIGSIIHNKDVVRRFQDLGMVTTTKAEGLVPGVALIRAHGIPDSLRRSYGEAGFTLVDSTCPIVAKGAVTLRNAASKGIRTIIIGVKGHAETEGLRGVETEDGRTVDSVLLCSTDDALALVRSKAIPEDEKIVVVVQTTFPDSEFQKIRDVLKDFYKDIRFSNAPCGATEKRQKAALSLASECDAVVVIGGKESENTRVLSDVVRQSGKPVFCIENADDIGFDMRKELSGFSVVGICSGSSTPTSAIRKVEEILEGI